MKVDYFGLTENSSGSEDAQLDQQKARVSAKTRNSNRPCAGVLPAQECD